MCTVACNLEALKGLSVGDINLPYFSTFLCYFISVHLSQKVKKKKLRGHFKWESYKWKYSDSSIINEIVNLKSVCEMDTANLGLVYFLFTW